MSEELQLMMAQIAHLGELSAAQARRVVDDVFRDGIVSREEAELLFRLNGRLEETEPDWSARFIEAIKDFLLASEPPAGFITQDEASWLQGQIERDGHVETDSELDLMLALLRYADGAPLSLSTFCLEAVSRRIIHEGRADEAMAERMRRVLHAPAGDGSVGITRREANVLFATNDAIARSANSRLWDTVFAKAVLNHLIGAAHPDPATEAEALSRQAWLESTNTEIGGFLTRMAGAFTSGSWFDKISHSEAAAARARHHAKEAARRGHSIIEPAEKNWLLRRLGWDKSVSPAERMLFKLLNEEAPGFVRGLNEAVKEDGFAF